jgi:hypothetical protein
MREKYYGARDKRQSLPHMGLIKVKRDGTCKARLCAQGSTLEPGVDYDQVFSAALRYSSARSFFAFAAKTGCRVRSVDLVAAYLQGDFLYGEMVYCHAAHATRLPQVR